MPGQNPSLTHEDSSAAMQLPLENANDIQLGRQKFPLGLGLSTAMCAALICLFVFNIKLIMRFLEYVY
jgi:hypothetical protein